MMLCMFCWNLAKADTEPNNNTSAGADNLSLNGSVAGTIGAADNNDYYLMTANADGDITINLSNTTNAYNYIYLYDNDGSTQLGTTSGYAGSGISLTVAGLSAGSYYVRVYSTDPLTSYSLSNTLALPAIANDAEPNDAYTSALTIAQNGSKSGHIAYRYNGGAIDNDDYYKMTSTNDGNITVSLSNNDNSYIYIYLYDNDGTTQLGTTSGYAGSGISFTANGLGAGDYYIRVYTS